jgi:hypothetical protein
MHDKTAWAAILGLILGSLLMGGCTSCSSWGNPGTAYPSGYGPAAGAGSAMGIAPSNNLTQPQVVDPGWRAPSNGALAPSGVPGTMP